MFGGELKAGSIEFQKTEAVCKCLITNKMSRLKGIETGMGLKQLKG